MIFSELYSAYYRTVAKILTAAGEGASEQELQKIVVENAFSESGLTILPALKSGRWPLLGDCLSPILGEDPTMPLTLLEKRWLKALEDDPRLGLFGVTLPGLEKVTPLFTREDYRIYDQYENGDPYEDPTYIRNFRLLLQAIREKKAVVITMDNKQGEKMWVRFYPVGLEYSLKDDKFRVLTKGCRFRQFNVAKLRSCEFYTGTAPWNEDPPMPLYKELVLEITDWRGALERSMLHFAHFEKQTERIGDNRYRLRLKYSPQDETELLIRVLSFGPMVQAMAPESFVERIRQRLRAQWDCALDD